ncbi:MAG: DUF3237 domain-containing protein [Lachnospiraceae bacterium]|nr:DUF3237 domain-containing protein [Lachnospiraceae bacterium]
MIKLFDIYVDITDTICVKGKLHDVCMLSFTGEARGRYFKGKVIGTGFDTQYSTKDNRMILSARYMLEGKDIDGKECRCFIENNGSFDDGFIPKIVTDSLALSEFEGAELKAEIETKENGVIVSIFG